MTREYRIGELAHEAGVTKRTIHYYIGRGLLPPAEGAGVGSTYNAEHLVKLRLIKQLQEQYLPLGRIREIVSALNLDEARQLLTDNYSPSSISPAPNREQEPRLTTDTLAEEPRPLEKPLTGSPPYNAKRSYIRCELGLGIELHFPAELLQNNSALINSIEKYVRRLIDEK